MPEDVKEELILLREERTRSREGGSVLERMPQKPSLKRLPLSRDPREIWEEVRRISGERGLQAEGAAS